MASHITNQNRLNLFGDEKNQSHKTLQNPCVFLLLLLLMILLFLLKLLMLTFFVLFLDFCCFLLDSLCTVTVQMMPACQEQEDTRMSLGMCELDQLAN